MRILTALLFVVIASPTLIAQGVEFINSDINVTSSSGTSYSVGHNASLTLKPGFHVNADTDGDFFAETTSNYVTIWDAKNNSNGTYELNFRTNPYAANFGYSYSFYVKWTKTDDTSVSGLDGPFTGDASVLVPEQGQYQVEISGDYPHLAQYPSGSSVINDIAKRLRAVKQWGTNEWQNMTYMFYGTNNISYEATDVPNLENVTSIKSMFHNSAFDGDVSQWNVENVTDFSSAFSDAYNFDQSLANWNIINATFMRRMLDNSSISQPNYDATLIAWSQIGALPSGITLGAQNMIYCDSEGARTTLLSSPLNWSINDDVKGCNAFITIWDTELATTDTDKIIIPTHGDNYFYYINWEALDGSSSGSSGPHIGDATINVAPGQYRVSIIGSFPWIYFGQFLSTSEEPHKLLEVEQWGDNQWHSMRYAFRGCHNFNITATDNPDLTLVTDMSSMFYQASSFNSNIDGWDVSNVTSMSTMFSQATSFNSSINSWDVSNVNFMSGMFLDASSFNKDLSGWANKINDVNMLSMFSGATAFNQPIGSWDITNATNINYMFKNASSFNQDLSAWGDKLENLTDLSGMFYGATSFNMDIDSWDVSSIENMSYMFAASGFNQSISSWNVSSVTDMSYMFENATSFNQNLVAWHDKVNNVTNMAGMFNGASSYNHSLGPWNISNVQNMSYMLDDCGMDRYAVDLTYSGWANVSGSETIPQNISLGANGLFYCQSGSDRNSLINNYNWVITGDQNGTSGGHCDGPDLDVMNENVLSSNEDLEVFIYPNPVDDILFVKIHTSENSLLISDMIGRSLNFMTLNQGQNEIDFSQMQSGIYLLTILSSSGHSRIVKIVKK